MSACAAIAPSPISAAYRKRLAQRIGKDLVERYGKKKYYSTAMVRSSARRVDSRPDWDCWAQAMFTSPVDFAEHHRAIGEVCDYAAMKAQMVEAVTDGASQSWFSPDLSWLDWPDFDLSWVFDVLS